MRQIRDDPHALPAARDEARAYFAAGPRQHSHDHYHKKKNVAAAASAGGVGTSGLGKRRPTENSPSPTSPPRQRPRPSTSATGQGYIGTTLSPTMDALKISSGTADAFGSTAGIQNTAAMPTGQTVTHQTFGTAIGGVGQGLNQAWPPVNKPTTQTTHSTTGTTKSQGKAPAAQTFGSGTTSSTSSSATRKKINLTDILPAPAREASPAPAATPPPPAPSRGIAKLLNTPSPPKAGSSKDVSKGNGKPKGTRK